MSFNRLGALFGQDLAHPRYTVGGWNIRHGVVVTGMVDK